MPTAMSTTPQARGRSSHRRARCRCLGGNKGERGTPCSCCSFNPLSSLFRCPGRDRSRSRSKHRQRTPSKVRDAPVAAGAQQQTTEEEPSFFVYTMPNNSGHAGTDEHKKKKKHRKPRMPSFGSCFRRKKKDRRQAKAAVATVSAPRRPALTAAASLLTHPSGSPASEKAQAATTPSVTGPPSPAPTENGSTTVNSPAPTPGRELTTARPASKHSADSTRPISMQPKQVVEIIEVATGERLSAHELGLIEMIGSSTEDSAESESSVKSSLDYVNELEPPLPPGKRTVVDREEAAAVPVPVKIKEVVPKLWLNGKSAESLVAVAAEELWTHDVACSRVHAVMLAETAQQPMA